MKRGRFKRKDAEKRRRKETVFGVNVSICLLVFASSIFGQEISVKAKLQGKDFPIVHQNRTADIYVSNEDFKVVRIAANDCGR